MANNNPMYQQDLPPFPHCSLHHEPIKGVCLFHGHCSDRLICRACRKSHDRNHLNNYEGLEDIFNGSLIKETMTDFEHIVGRIDSYNQGAITTSQHLVGQINTQFNEVKDYILKKLEHARAEIVDDIQQKFQPNTGAKNQIIQQSTEVQKAYEVAAKNGFQNQNTILNVITALINAQGLKEKINRDPELNAQQTGELTSRYMNVVNSGSLVQTVKHSFDRICDDVTQGFMQRSGVGNEQFNSFQNEMKRSMQKLGAVGGGDFGGSGGFGGFGGGFVQNQQDFQTNLTNILNNAAANSRKSIGKGFLAQPTSSGFGGGFGRGGFGQGGQSGLFTGGNSAFDSQENSRGFDNEFNNRRFGNQQRNNGNGNMFLNKKTPNPLPQKILQPQTHETHTDVPDFTTLVRGISASDLVHAQSELKLKAPQNSFAFESTSMILGSNKQSMNKQFQNTVIQLEELVENEQFQGEQPYDVEGQGGIIEEEQEGEGGQNANNMSIIEQEPYDPDQGGEENEGNQMLEEEYNPQESQEIPIEKPKQVTEKPKVTPQRLLEMFKKVQEESSTRNEEAKSSTRREETADPRKRSVSPIEDKSEQVKYLSHFYTTHQKISAGAMVYISSKKHLATGGQDGKIEIWDLDSQRNVKTLKAHKEEVFRLYYVEGHDVLVSCGGDGIVNVWDCNANYNSVKVYDKHQGPVYAVEYLANMNMMVSGGEDGLLRIWSLEGVKEDYAVKIQNAHIGSLCYFGSKKRLVVGLNNGGLKIYNMETSVKKLVGQCQGHNGAGFVLNMAGVDEKGVLLTAGEDGLMKMWRLNGDNLTMVHEFGQKEQPIRSFVFSERKDLILTNHADRKIRLWRGSNGQKIGEKYDRSYGESCLLFRENLKMITAHDGEVKLWQINV